MADALRAPIMGAMSRPGKSPLLTRSLRLLRLAAHLLRGLLTVALFFPFYAKRRQVHAVLSWSADLLRILGVRVRIHGELSHARPLMIVANHVSWLDIFTLNAVSPVRFVAKSEIRRWPAIGWLSARTGTLFIERGRRRDTARVSGLVTEAMRNGDVVAVFPEGTTTDGSQVLRFHSSLLQPALAAEAGVQPVALRFERSDGSLCVEAAYDGDKSLWHTLLQIVAEREIIARLHFLPLLQTGTADRRALANSAQAAIISSLQH